MKTIFVNPKDVTRKWYLIDAGGKTLGRVAVEVVNLLRGKNKAEFTPHQEVGDYVVVINAADIVVSGNKMAGKLYYRHSGYPGGLRSETLETVLKRKPTFPMENAIRGMLPKNRLGRKLFTNVKVYAGAKHPHDAQKPEILVVG